MRTVMFCFLTASFLLGRDALDVLLVECGPAMQLPRFRPEGLITNREELQAEWPGVIPATAEEIESFG